MNWEAIGAIGEVSAAVATLAMLVYLSVQVRHARDATQSASELEASKLITQINQHITDDSNLRRIFDLVADDREEEMSDGDVSHYLWLVATFAHAAEGVWLQFEKGLISKKVWEKWERSFGTNLNSPIIRSWWSQARISFSTEFYDHFDVLLQQIKTRSFPLPKKLHPPAAQMTLNMQLKSFCSVTASQGSVCDAVVRNRRMLRRANDRCWPLAALHFVEFRTI